jgi:hypothetical protein
MRPRGGAWAGPAGPCLAAGPGRNACRPGLGRHVAAGHPEGREEPGAGSGGPGGAGSRGNREPGTGSRGRGNREPGTGSRGRGNREPVPEGRREAGSRIGRAGEPRGRCGPWAGRERRHQAGGSTCPAGSLKSNAAGRQKYDDGRMIGVRRSRQGPGKFGKSISVS